MKILITAFAFSIAIAASGQENCDFAQDTLSVPGVGSVMDGQSIRVPLKDGGEMVFFRAGDGRAFLRIEITRNLYFNMTDVLEIRSGTKSFYARNTLQQKSGKSRGRFTVEIARNYAYTLKESGITGVTFNKADTDFSRQDLSAIRKAAECIYHTLK